MPNYIELKCEEFENNFMKSMGASMTECLENGDLRLKALIRTSLTDLLTKAKEAVGEEYEPATGHPAQFNYDPEWYKGANYRRKSTLNNLNKLQ